MRTTDTNRKQVDPDAEPYRSLIGYFEASVLAAYRNQPDKYRIEGDASHGRITLTNSYNAQLDSDGRTRESIDVQFGYRTLKNGDTALVVFLLDLTKKSKGHLSRWAGVRISNPKWSAQPDERFNQWVRPNLGGVWNVGPEVRSRLAKAMHTINCVTHEAVGKPLFTHELSPSLIFPAAENSHQYQDAHKEIYRYLIDSLDHECIEDIAKHLGKPIKIRQKWTVMDLKKVFPNLEAPSKFAAAYDLVSNQRGRAAHKVRPPAERMPAFEQFTRDLELCVMALGELLSTLEKELGMNGDKATERNDAKTYLPGIARPAEPRYSICQASQMRGKTVERVEFGTRAQVEHAHRTEVLIIHFTDGSILSIDTNSNVGNLAEDLPELKGEDFDVSFSLHWVPEK